MGLTIKKRHGNLQTIGLVAMTALIGVSFLLHQVTASAAGANWMDSDPVVKHVRPLDSAVDPNANVRGHCKLETVTVAKTYDDKEPTMKLTLCLNEFNGWQFGQANGWYDVYASNGGLFYKVNSLSALHWFQGTDTIIGMHRGYAFDYDEISHLKKYNNFTKRFTMSSSKKSFDFDMSNPAFSLDYKGKPMYAISWGISNNGRYLVYSGSARHVNAYDIFSRIDLETGERKVFGRGYYDHTHNVEPQPSVAVSNDGTQVVIGGTAAFKVWRITPECLVDREKMKDEFRDPCPTRMIYPKFYGDQWKNIEASHERISANDDFTELMYQHRALRGQAINEVVTISIAKDEPQASRLDYLAMGDSYSSGEGDIQNGVSSHYIRETGGKEDCHLSSRSYPFLLAKAWNVPDGKFNTIACSGARVIHDYIFRLKYYSGQNNTIWDKMTGKNKDAVVEKALRDFLPGYVPQLEFVKKYQPRVITLTGGGNDVGFGDVLRACIIGSWQSPSLCVHAIPGSRLNKMLKDSIHNQYGVTKLLIKKIREASPKTKIYIIGYPQFIAKGTQNCYFNAMFINPLERALIVNMTQEMNEVLSRAATDSGVPFIDLSNSLVGGRLCDLSSSFVTGSHNLIPNINDTTVQNLFHPSPLGHVKMASDILSRVSDIYRGNNTPKSTALPTSKLGHVYEQAPVTSKLNTSYRLQTEAGSPLRVRSDDRLKPGSKVRVTLYSTPQDLGEYVVGDSGNVDLNLAIPKNVEPGQHTIVLDGVSNDGRRVTYYGFMAVTAINKKVQTKDTLAKIQPKHHTAGANKATKTQNSPQKDEYNNLPHLITINIIIVGGVAYVIHRLKR